MKVIACKVPNANRTAILVDNKVLASCGAFIMLDANMRLGYVEGVLLAASDIDYYEDVDLFEGVDNTIDRSFEIKSFQHVIEMDYTFYTTDGSEVLYTDLLINLQNLWLMPIYRCEK